MTATQLVHEAEAQRQHPRLRIPVSVEVDGTRYQARDLSVGGLGLPATAPRLRRGRRTDVTLGLPFDDFEMSLPLAAEVRHEGTADIGSGLQFTDLNPRQLSFLHYIVNGYLSGQVVRAGDVFDVASRDASSEPRKAKDAPGTRRRSRGRVRKVLGFALLALIAPFCIGFIVLSMAERTFVTEAAGTLSSRHAVVIRAPVGGVVRSVLATPGEELEDDTVLAVVESSGGATSLVRSPCSCVMATMYVSEGEYVNVNQALLALTPDAAAQVVLAKVPLEAARSLKPGDAAFVDFFDGRQSMAGIVETITATSIDPNSYAGRSFNTQPLAKVNVRLDENLPVSSIGQPVAVRISSLPRILNAAAARMRE